MFLDTYREIWSNMLKNKNVTQSYDHSLPGKKTNKTLFINPLYP